MRTTDYTGCTFGACHVIGPAGEPRKWLTRCTRCGRESIKSSDSLRTLKNIGGHEGCNACRERTYAHLKAINPPKELDIGHVNEDGAGFSLTPLGRLQMDFYLGRMGRGSV